MAFAFLLVAEWVSADFFPLCLARQIGESKLLEVVVGDITFLTASIGFTHNGPNKSIPGKVQSQ